MKMTASAGLKEEITIEGDKGYENEKQTEIIVIPPLYGAGCGCGAVYKRV